MDIPDYRLAPPKLELDTTTTDSFDRLLDHALRRGSERPIDYRLAAPKGQFLCHVADRAGLVLHGSGGPGITCFQPRQPADPLKFSNRRGVFAATDGIWPMYYAVLDRVRCPTLSLNASVRIGTPDGLSAPLYYFSIGRTALQRRPWRPGTVYLLPGDSFESQPPIAVDDTLVHVAQAASPVPVTPVASLAVAPEEFSFLGQVRGHDDDVVAARMAADPGGFPWLGTRHTA